MGTAHVLQFVALSREDDESFAVEEAELAGNAVHLAVADFMLAIHHARTVDEALKIRVEIAKALASLEAMEGAATDRAEQLNR